MLREPTLAPPSEGPIGELPPHRVPGSIQTSRDTALWCSHGEGEQQPLSSGPVAAPPRRGPAREGRRMPCVPPEDIDLLGKSPPKTTGAKQDEHGFHSRESRDGRELLSVTREHFNHVGTLARSL